jgi:dipeptidyl aminopeptidase/acylaminoacyl peptidase
MDMVSRRSVLIGVGTSVAACSPALAQPNEGEKVGHGLRLRATDYAADRSSFQTRLLFEGPSPQRSEMPKTPDGVREAAYRSGDMNLKTWIAMPEQSRARSPAVIFLHGGFAFGADDFDMARPYLTAGYVVATPILRGENGQEGHFSMFYDEVNDVLAAADYVRRQSFVDPAHVFLAGHSVGGTMTMLAGMASRQFRAIASFSGSPDQAAFTAEQPWSRIVPFDQSNPAELEMRSPLAYARSFKSPARLFHGSQESFFRESTRSLVSIARNSGLDVQAVPTEGDHFGAVPEEIAQSIAFFRSV